MSKRKASAETPSEQHCVTDSEDNAPTGGSSVLPTKYSALYSDVSYHIVEFSDEKIIEIVHGKWLRRNLVTKKVQCHWPPFNEKRIQKAVRAAMVPSQEWDLYDCRHLGSSSDYERAQEMAELARYTSNMESDFERATAMHPQRKQKRSSSHVEEMENHPPVKKFMASSATHSPVLQKLPSSSTPRSAKYKLPGTLATPASSEGSSHYQAKTAFEMFMVTKLKTLEQEQKETKEEIRKLMTGLDPKLDLLLNKEKIAAPHINLPEEVNFPVRTVEELTALEANLADVELKNFVVAHLGFIGGRSVKECTRRLMRYIMSDSCARHYNWIGKNDKIPFAEFKLTKVIICAVRENAHTANATNSEVENYIKEWLRFAPARDEGRRGRQKKKVLAEVAADQKGMES